MGNFLKKVTAFLIPLLIIFIFLEIKLSHIPTYLLQKKLFIESQIDEIEIISTGLSYGNSINPEFIDRKAFNFFHDAQDLYYDIQLINKYIERMPNLKLIILPISYFSLEYRMESSPWIWRAPFYKFIYDIPPSNAISNFNPIFYSYTLAYGWREVQNYISTDFVSKIDKVMYRTGWREVGNEGIVDSKESDRFGWQSAEYYETSLMQIKNISFNMKLLENFIKGCNNKNIKVIFITPPVFHNFYDYVNPTKYAIMQSNINLLVKKYDLFYFNYFTDKRFTADDFYSVDHVNNYGAAKLSKIINEEINSILDKSN